MGLYLTYSWTFGILCGVWLIINNIIGYVTNKMIVKSKFSEKTKKWLNIMKTMIVVMVSFFVFAAQLAFNTLQQLNHLEGIGVKVIPSLDVAFTITLGTITLRDVVIKKFKEKQLNYWMICTALVAFVSIVAKVLGMGLAENKIAAFILTTSGTFLAYVAGALPLLETQFSSRSDKVKIENLTTNYERSHDFGCNVAGDLANRLGIWDPQVLTYQHIFECLPLPKNADATIGPRPNPLLPSLPPAPFHLPPPIFYRPPSNFTPCLRPPGFYVPSFGLLPIAPFGEDEGLIQRSEETREDEENKRRSGSKAEESRRAAADNLQDASRTSGASS